ncbi:DNA polymerase III subunit alpha [Saccharicrinis fermentans]|uniref:DNA-directed DNA polymerase n=1 Tax=Saccharicrinis fermentans DSM 9555 = JCM 21142 TaxID=869213 RepID=W7YKX8_9BACT|nr:DNA polymerase III subunit alpha [Saccharicrinis fermentans]GAF03014.1 DNA polymerase III subunit alpha [Saccharicrinis fermentans DSM 9555 = JCM 21142]
MLLNCHSYYSFKYGTLSVEELLTEASSGGHNSIALTDINNTAVSLDFVRQAKEHNIRPIVGADIRNGVQQQFVAIAKNTHGFSEINEFLNLHKHNNLQFKPQAPDYFQNTFIIYPFQSQLRELEDYEYIGITPQDLRNLPFTPWKKHLDKLVIQQTATFRNKRDYNIHRLLRAIDKNTLLSKLSKEEQASFNDQYKSHDKLLSIYENYPPIIANTQKLLDTCNMEFTFKTNKNKKVFTNSKEEDFQYLKAQAYKGLKYRYDKVSDKVLVRLEKELSVIKELDFCAYFLINWDLVQYALSKGYYHVGRGSGANSLTAYLLRITNVDPVELDLYFERFINTHRSSPPDFDIDFSWTDRDDVTRYLFDKYGWDHTALLGSFITFNHKSAFREIGKVFGLPEEEITRLQKNPNPDLADEYGKWVIRYSAYISNFPSHPSIHSSGILISEEPISNYSATELLPKGFPSTQFDMYIAEDIGLHKFDILSQRGLGKIKDTLNIIKENHGIDIDINNTKVFMEDPKVKSLLKKGQAIGCFYIESPAMRMLLTKLKAEDYKRLVAASSIIRPGVAQSGMMREYIIRFQNPNKRTEAQNALPALYEILEETYGVMVYQEDVIKVAHYFAGLTLDEADILRRGMSWKFKQRNEFGKVRNKFFTNCKNKGYPDEVVQDIWRQIESFANYAFAKGHSASYAVESFQALYLKAYYPLEYMVATLNNGGGFYSPQLYLHDAVMHGATIEVPCINQSFWENTIKGNTIFLGFYLLRDLEKEMVRTLLNERGLNGSYLHLRDFVKRVPISLEQLSILIRIGAFRFTGIGKKELLWDAHFLLGHNKKTKPQRTLFQAEVKEFQLPALWQHRLEDAFDEMELLGLSIRSPFELVRDELPSSLKACHLPQLMGKLIRIVGYLIHRKPTRTSNGKTMFFGTWIDIDGHWLDTVHFPPAAQMYPFRGPGCYVIEA